MRATDDRNMLIVPRAPGMPVHPGKLTQRPSCGSKQRWLVGAVMLIAVALTLFFDWRSDAFSGEYEGAPDEAAHYVTGIMIRDYLRLGFPGDPVDFAKTFYRHYPRVSFGAWPPLFHITEGIWMTVISPSRISVILFVGSAMPIPAYSSACRRFRRRQEW
jgi:hypothetical protein